MNYKLVENLKTKKFDLLDKDGNIILGISNLLEPIQIEKTLEVEEKSKVLMRTYENNMVRTFSMNLDKISENNKFYATLLNNTYFISPNLIQHLRDHLNQKLQILQTSKAIKYYHKSLGFYEEPNKKLIFLYDKSSTSRGISHYYNDKFQFKSGKEKEYLDFLSKEILPYNEMQLALVLGLSSVTASYLDDYADIQTIVLNICGESSTGKSTTAQFIASLWASPKISNNALVKTFNSTDFARLSSIEGMNGVPIIFDDATTAPGLNRTKLIYQLAQGESRARMTNYGHDISQGKTWSGLSLITSETPILSDSETRQGLISRVIDSNNIVWTHNANHAERIKQKIKDCFGHIGPSFASEFLIKVQNNPRDMIDLFKKAKSEVIDNLKKVDNLTQRIVNKLAIIHLTTKLVIELLKLQLNENDILKLLISFDQDNIEERNLGMKAIEVIKDYIERYNKKFRKLNNGALYSSETTELLGILDFNEDLVKVTIPAETVKEILRKNRIYEYKAVLKKWSKAGLIQQQSGHNTINLSQFNSRAIKFNLEPSDDMIIAWGCVKDLSEKEPDQNEEFQNMLEERRAAIEEADKEAISEIFKGDSNEN